MIWKPRVYFLIACPSNLEYIEHCNMPLTLIPTPIGHSDDFTLRGLAELRAADHIIVEERKESTRWLRAHGITKGQYETLNEHSTAEDLSFLTEMCRTSKVALITDCGTPGFCDPGADLVRRCRDEKIHVQALPGASSLMTLLSLSGERLDQFVFRGFLPVKTEEREPAWRELQRETRAVVLLETPYRCRKWLNEAAQFLPDRRFLLALNLTQESEFVVEALGRDLPGKVAPDKAELICLLLAKSPAR
jgi:16S rRNA (cytidine1402-2'-O)-methyltransferase